ncbi:MAG TPA: FAD-dependent monooxygenase [Beijerinckiaceae bacterium]
MDDVIIVGGGVMGSTLALALCHVSRGRLKVRLLDARSGETRDGARTSAIARGPRRMLERLGVWASVAAAAQPIMRMSIGDLSGPEDVKTSLLSFDAQGGEPLAHMVFHRDLEPMLSSAARDAGVAVQHARVVGFAAFQGHAEVRTSDGETHRARLVVAADGARSPVREQARLRTIGWDYDRAAIVTTISHERPHDGVAVQHFLPHGPIALLPVTGDRTSIVWTTGAEMAQRLLALAPADFELELDQVVDRRLGRISVVDAPRAFPLTYAVARRFAAARVVLVGDAAHRVHPLAGQGLNIGLRDVATLVDVILAEARLGLDIGSTRVTDSYHAARYFDVVTTSAAFDLMHRLFGLDDPATRALRGAGMRATDVNGALKRYLMEEAAGLSGETPSLFR